VELLFKPSLQVNTKESLVENERSAQSSGFACHTAALSLTAQHISGKSNYTNCLRILFKTIYERQTIESFLCARFLETLRWKIHAGDFLFIGSQIRLLNFHKLSSQLFRFYSMYGWKHRRLTVTSLSNEDISITHFTLHLLSDWRVSDSSSLAYLRERTWELDIGAFLYCKDSKICFVGLAYGIAKAGE